MTDLTWPLLTELFLISYPGIQPSGDAVVVDIDCKKLVGRMEAYFGKPLDFLKDDYFDIVLSALALDYVEDWSFVFREFHRVLRREGVFVFSIEHPFAKYTNHGENDYFGTELISIEWRGFGEPENVPSYRRPLEEVGNSLLEAGLALDRVLEPRPTEDFKKADPEEYKRLRGSPGFLCVRAGKR